MPAESHLLTVAAAVCRRVQLVGLRTPLRLGAFATLSLLATWPLLSSGSAVNSFRDAQVLGHYEFAAAQAVLRFHQLPLWDPYYCGGMYLLGTPQARFVSPTFLFTLLLGEPRGEAVTAFAMIVVGLEGAFRYARSRGARSSGALLGAPLFALSGLFALSPALGWTNFFSFELLPWAAFGTHAALSGRRIGVPVAATALGWSVGFGGTYAAPLAALWCGLELVDTLTTRERRTRLSGTLAYAGLIAALSLSLAAVRLWPVVETLRDGQRIIGGSPANSWMQLARMTLFGAGDHDSGSFFIGAFAVPAVLLGLSRARAWRLAVAGVLCFWLAAGYAAWPPLFAALRTLPVFSTLRYPERFLVLAALAVCALAANGVAAVEGLAARAKACRASWVPRRLALWAPAATGVLLLFAIGTLVAQHWRQASGRELLAPPPETADGAPFHQARGNRWALAFYEPMNRGSLSCWEAYAVPESPLLRGDLTNEEQLVDEAAGSVVERAWSPNRIDLDVDITRPSRLLVNQNWHSGWHASVGEVRNEHGLLAVDLPTGTHALSLRFAPESAKRGALVSAVAAASIVAIAWDACRRRRRRSRAAAVRLGLAAAAPCAAFAVCFASARTSAAPRAVPTAIDGGPVIVDSLPDAAIRTGTRFAAGITLEAATLSNGNPSPNDTVFLELDWRRAPEIPPRLGIFVHIEPPKGDLLNGDHVLLSSTLDFSDAPPDKILRDVLPVSIPDDAAGKTFKIWVGLWAMRGDGRRIPVLDVARLVVKDDGVLAATIVVPRKP